jgi:hypothetical protein
MHYPIRHLMHSSLGVLRAGLKLVTGAAVKLLRPSRSVNSWTKNYILYVIVFCQCTYIDNELFFFAIDCTYVSSFVSM